MLKMTKDEAKKILLLRDALVQDNISEAYHQLYSIADPSFSSHTPWKVIEELANAQAE